MNLSNSQITKLGDRLRNGNINDDDLVMLDDFRKTFENIELQCYKVVNNVLNDEKLLKITQRKRKTQQSIIDKLRREKRLRLPQMQDIAGCRIVINGGLQMAEKINTLLTEAFDEQEWKLQSKERQSHGYRAIHIIVQKDKKYYEIQLRTYAQDIWANIIESQADETNSLKYGGSEDEQMLMKKLMLLSDKFFEIDNKNFNNFNDYESEIKKEINNVLSNRT